MIPFDYGVPAKMRVKQAGNMATSTRCVVNGD
jgi:hypothetical protein